MGKKLDLTGQSFGKLTVLREDSSRIGGSVAWVCQCSCGSQKVVPAIGLRQGSSTSCGCVQREKIGSLNRTHGETGRNRSKEHRAWSHMLSRCQTATDPNYPQYGGRGIKVCPEWQRYEQFLLDMGRAPHPNHTLERKDVNGPYDPGNCLWADWFTQANNRRNNRLLVLGSETRTVAQWARTLGYSDTQFRNALQGGKTLAHLALEKGYTST